MTKGTTSSGFEFEYDEQRLDDMRFVDILAVVADDKARLLDRVKGLSQLIDMLLGSELKERLYDHIGSRFGGRVPREEAETALTEIMAAAGKDAEKNS